MKYTLTALSMVAIMLTTTARGAGIPTYDALNVVQTTKTAIQAAKQAANQLKQLKALRDYIDTMSGNYSMGDLVNGTVYRDARRYIPKNWRDTLRILETGNNPATYAGIEAAMEEARQDYSLPNAEAIFDDADSDLAQRYTQRNQHMFSTSGLARVAYRRSTDQLLNIEKLIDEIDSAEDMKATADLQNRILGQLALLQVEAMRLQAIFLERANTGFNVDTQRDRAIHIRVTRGDKLKFTP